MDKISVVIPCYYNQANIPSLSEFLVKNEGLFNRQAEFEYILVDDGSEDKTWDRIKDFKKQFPEKVIGVRLARNIGSYNAIYAGLEKATGSCTVVMAADLQDPPSHIKLMFAEWKEGHKLILANRLNSEGLAGLYFGLLRLFGLKNLPKGGFDFCLFSKELRQQLLAFQPKGANSLYHLLQLENEPVLAPYKKQPRQMGKSKWTTWKKVALALCTFERYSSMKMAHLSISMFLLAAFSMILSIQFTWTIALGLLSLSTGIQIEIIRTTLRSKQQDLTIVVKQAI